MSRIKPSTMMLIQIPVQIFLLFRNEIVKARAFSDAAVININIETNNFIDLNKEDSTSTLTEKLIDPNLARGLDVILLNYLTFLNNPSYENGFALTVASLTTIWGMYNDYVLEQQKSSLISWHYNNLIDNNICPNSEFITSLSERELNKKLVSYQYDAISYLLPEVILAPIISGAMTVNNYIHSRNFGEASVIIELSKQILTVSKTYAIYKHTEASFKLNSLKTVDQIDKLLSACTMTHFNMTEEFDMGVYYYSSQLDSESSGVVLGGCNSTLY